MTVRAAALPADPTAVPTLVAQAKTLAARIVDNARAPEARQGPYR